MWSGEKPNSPLQKNLTAVTRLTALWALAESGLGGIMFALRIPFTGFFIGAIAIVLLGLIAKFSNYSYRHIISSTIIVIIVKAAVSPHSSLPAYFAVGFQGFAAALLFSTIRSHKLACVLLGILSMAESALQKIIVLTLLFGTNIWEATHNLVKELAKNFSIGADHNYTQWIIGVYVLLYMLWGAAVGFFAASMPAAIEKQKICILQHHLKIRSEQTSALIQSTVGKKRRQWIIYTILLLFIITVFLLSGADGKQVAAIVLRSLAAILVLIIVVQPLLKFFFNKWLSKRMGEEKERTGEVMQVLPLLRSYVPAAYAVAKTKTGFLKQLKYFVVVMIVLTLYAVE